MPKGARGPARPAHGSRRHPDAEVGPGKFRGGAGTQAYAQPAKRGVANKGFEISPADGIPACENEQGGAAALDLLDEAERLPGVKFEWVPVEAGGGPAMPAGQTARAGHLADPDEWPVVKIESRHGLKLPIRARMILIPVKPAGAPWN